MTNIPLARCRQAALARWPFSRLQTVIVAMIAVGAGL